MEKNKILVLGRGFLGTAFEKAGYTVAGRDKFNANIGITYDYLKVLPQLLRNYDAVVNCIGRSNTRWCERPENSKETFFVNGFVPGILSDTCENLRKKFVHISTGCLYDDGKAENPWTEEAPLVPHCKYTESKKEGEDNCNLERDLILRPRLLFGDFAPREGTRNNLLCKLPHFNKFLIEDNSYTSVHTIVDATQALLDAEQVGIFNVANEGYAKVIEVAGWIGLRGEGFTSEELIKQENLHLVNNVMNIGKLQEFYKPSKLKDEVMRCWEKLQK